MAATVRIGTCSWADEALSKWFYPPKLPAKERLAWYAEHFDTVEVDSTYYRLPSESMVQGWAERTPDGFTMHVKAFGLMTRHPVKAETIPEDLRAEMPVDERGRVDRPPRELRGEIFRRFLEALEPLRAAGKLGGILFQLPPYIVYKESSLDYLEWAREQLGGDEMLVEFRHRSWLDDENRAASLAFLERIGAGYVVVDAPRSDTAKNLVPTVVATTSPTAYVRFHGRNLGTWNKRGGSAAERFDYLYSDEELGEWVGPLRELAGQSEQAYAFFNNNASSEDPDNPLRPRLAGGDERAPAAAAPRREPDRRERRRSCRVNVLSIVHGEDAGPELFGPLVAEAGHRRDEWSFERGEPPPDRSTTTTPCSSSAASCIPTRTTCFPWLPDETEWLRGLRRAADADARHLPRIGAARAGDGRLGRAARRCPRSAGARSS